MQTILINFGKKIKFLQSSHQRDQRNDQDNQDKEVFTPPFTLTSWRMFAHLSFYVNSNEKYTQLDERAIIQQTINLRLLVNKNTKSCDGKLACSDCENVNM